MARLLLGVTGGIAAYKSIELARLAIKAGHSVRVIQTPDAAKFIGPSSFAAITGAPVLIDQWDKDPLRGVFPGDPQPDHEPLSHLSLVASADLFLIAPASANTLAKLASGMADNLLCLTALACQVPLIVAPAMNDAMYNNPATRRNLELLQERGTIILKPDVGPLGSLGEWGIGRMVEPSEILKGCEKVLESAASTSWSKKRVLVTAGGTREPIDAVRFIGNRSSGRMGYALAQAAHDRGAEVTVISANVDLAQIPGVSYISVTTADELKRACLDLFSDSDALFMAAAVSDFTPVSTVGEKIKKQALPQGLTVSLKPAPDILAELRSSRRNDQLVVGFAAEFGDKEALRYGSDKLKDKQLDAIVVNDVSKADIGFESKENEVTVIVKDGQKHITKAKKELVAGKILDYLQPLLETTSMKNSSEHKKLRIA